jgi:hypothetical protein
MITRNLGRKLSPTERVFATF